MKFNLPALIAAGTGLVAEGAVWLVDHNACTAALVGPEHYTLVAALLGTVILFLKPAVQKKEIFGPPAQ